MILSQEKLQQLIQELKFQYSRSSGPGGQKVNKTETRVELSWQIRTSAVFNDQQKTLIFSKLSNRISKEGILNFSSDRYRSRNQNQDHCVRKLVAAIEKALHVAKKRKKTKPTKSSIEKRIKNKKQLSDKKKMRQKVH